jgi:mycothiol synthase
MPITRRPLLPSDWPAALALADRSPLSLPHLADWPYRGASWALDAPENASVWLDDAGQLQGWAVLQTPFWAIDAVVHPAAPPALYRELLAWATTRAQELRMAKVGRPMWFVSIAATCRDQRQTLDAHGFIDVSEADIDPWSKVLFALPTESVVAEPPLPAGMTIRSLRVPQEIEPYVALHRAVFQSENMTRAWRERTTQMPGYRNELDLVLVADTGELCGFCVAWQRDRAAGHRGGLSRPPAKPGADRRGCASAAGAGRVAGGCRDRPRAGGGDGRVPCDGLRGGACGARLSL